jgi:hypothetical protein
VRLRKKRRGDLGDAWKTRPKRSRLEGTEDEHIEAEARKNGRYGQRAKEVAARTVMKHPKEEGHAKVK